jgi:hypothetical protein
MICGSAVFYLLTLNDRQETAQNENAAREASESREDQSLPAETEAEKPAPDSKSPEIASTAPSADLPAGIETKPNNDLRAQNSPNRFLARSIPAAQPSLDNKIVITRPEIARTSEAAAPTRKAPDAAPRVSAGKTASNLAVFVVYAGALRGEGEQSLVIKPNIERVGLLFNLPRESKAYEFYRATLKTADGETVFASPKLKALSLTVPAVKLENRMYLIFLEGQNGTSPYESITEYTFIVRR